MRRALRAALPAAVLLLPACAAAVPAVSALSAGAAAGEKGFSFWQSGRLYYVDEGTMEDMCAAIATTIDALDLEVHAEDVDTEDGVLRGRDWAVRTERGHLARIEVERLSSAMVSVELNAGSFGNRAAIELVAQRIKHELDAIHAARDPGVMKESSPGPS